MNLSSLRSAVVLVAILTSTCHGQNASLSVLHGIPGLPVPVEVFANGGSLFSFDFTELAGPLSLPPATYFVEVRLQGSTVLSANVPLAAGQNYTAVAHLLPGGGLNLALFQNNINPLVAGEARATVRHLADAPAVDVLAGVNTQGNPSLFSAVASNVVNGQEAVAETHSGLYDVRINAAGTSTTVAGPLGLELADRANTVVYAIGALGSPSFQLAVQTINLAPPITATISGTSCGGNLTVSNTSFDFDTSFTVGLTGGLPGASGLIHIGTSSTALAFLPLPLDLANAGAPGCFLYQNDVVGSAISLDALGRYSLTTSIPRALLGTFDSAFVQITYVDPTANALGIVFSELLSVQAPN